MLIIVILYQSGLFKNMKNADFGFQISWLLNPYFGFTDFNVQILNLQIVKFEIRILRFKNKNLGYYIGDFCILIKKILIFPISS